MKVSDNALQIMKERVLHEGEEPMDMVLRVAKNVAMGDRDLEKSFIDVMSNLLFLPNSPCLVNAGTKVGQLSACFVLPIEDSMESIMQTLYDASMIQKTGGGTGFSFSHLRPKGSKVNSTNGEASGPVSFMRMYNAVMEEIKQGGRRRGASLGVLRVDHPDILEFIECKRNQDQLTSFNISVGVTDEFMERVMLGEPRPTKIWHLLAECAWETGEPGILFLDTINKYNPTPTLGMIEACNPCSEANLLPYESCVLGSINLAKMVYDRKVNYPLLGSVTDIAVEFLDNVIDCTNHPLPKIGDATRRTRKIGIGIMGLADMFYLMGVRYGSEESLEIAKTVMGFINSTADSQSRRLAKIKGAYPECPVDDPRRNAVVTSIAPTGTLASIAGASFSAEPNYGLVYTRNILDGKELHEVNPVFQVELERRWLDKQEIYDKVARNNGSVQGLKEIPQDMQEIFITAHDLHWKTHVEMQAELQKYVEQSISKTINFPSDATVNDIADAYMMAWKKGCKGITVYRDGSREKQVLSTKHKPSERPHTLYGRTSKYRTGCGSLYVTVNEDAAGDPHEIFANHSQRDGCVVALLNALARVTSISLRSGVDPTTLSQAMMGQVCGECDDITSCADAVGRALLPDMVCTIGGECPTCG